MHKSTHRIIYAQTNQHIHTCKHTLALTYLLTHTNTLAFIQRDTHTNTDTHTQTRTRIHAPHTHSRTRTDTHAHTHTGTSTSTHTSTSIHTHTHTYTHTHARIRTHTSTHEHSMPITAHSRTRTHTHTHTHTHIRLSPFRRALTAQCSYCCAQIYRSYIALGQFDVVQDEVKEDAQTALQAVKLLATFKSKSVSMCRETQAALILLYCVCVCVDMQECVRDRLLRFIRLADVCVSV